MLPDQPILAVTFDMDGLLVNSEDVYERVGSETLRRRGKSFDTALRDAMMGRPAPDALRVMIEWHNLTDHVDALVAESDATFWEMSAGALRLMPAVEQTLAAVEAKGLPKGVATSGAREYANRILTAVGIRDRFDFILTASDVTAGKPSPEIYLLAADRHGVPADRMLVLEDSATGCQAAVAAGAFAVGVPSPHTAGHAFPGAAFVADTLRDPRIAQVLAV
ncbi:Phosphorylated carbohydrates phosphatase [Pirellulimonas nuda]|uniref:Phosphorylated carbohydrates phosphatase n=1 Tax=Pirellulimonas nuda TaxID=2528009 RepID=A0A518DFA8_9BACT|nr:HAD-IA family hydrolase [Pirellulimonas nuda]QDU90163.1 Phosphorylated carbohydrates phosphatase [Pirellulimonas nuda]